MQADSKLAKQKFKELLDQQQSGIVIAILDGSSTVIKYSNSKFEQLCNYTTSKDNEQ